jgi:hypothetical protein
MKNIASDANNISAALRSLFYKWEFFSSLTRSFSLIEQYVLLMVQCSRVKTFPLQEEPIYLCLLPSSDGNTSSGNHRIILYIL